MQRQARKLRLWQRDAFGPFGQAATPALPSLAGKMGQSLACDAARTMLVAFEGFDETFPERAFVETQTARPFFTHLTIAQIRQTVEQLLARLLQVPPIGVRVQLGKTLGKRTATAESNTEVVHWPCGKVVGR
jgi:hypothetical protein